ncbi:MAG TPA: GNAT family N-acetyltransferase [Thermomicrobiales bacterium]|nr:GNAT family N-acetyltransferase [Thermomicrobiales bacterium]
MTKESAPTPRIAPPLDAGDRAWLVALWREAWGGETMVAGGRTLRLDRLTALLAWAGAARVGAATYVVEGDDCELVSLNAVAAGRGVGTALLAAVEAAARAAGCRRVRLITTNDNLDALGFYQRRGYRLVALRPGAVDEARHLKPTIPAVGEHGIPLHDELELAKML